MGILLDGIIIIFLLASIYLGYRKGLITLGIQLVAFILALVVTLILYKPVGNMIINVTPIDEKLQEVIQTNVENIMQEGNDNSIAHELVESAKQGMLPEASRSLAVNIVYGMTMLLLFILVRIVLAIVNTFANTIAKLPILKQFNKLGGILYGLLRGLLITYAVLLIFNLVIAFNPKNSLGKMVEESYLAKTMSHYNILSVFF